MSETLFETTIVLNEEKFAECPYSREKVDEYLREMFALANMMREGNTFKSATFALISGVMVTLYKNEWFMRLVKEWTLTEKDGERIVSEENVLENGLLRKKYLNKYGI